MKLNMTCIKLHKKFKNLKNKNSWDQSNFLPLQTSLPLLYGKTTL